MTALDPHCNGRPTRIGVHAIRADLVWRYALERRDRIGSLDDVRALCPSWSAAMFADAVDYNVALGRFAESATGRLTIEEPER